MMQQFFTVPKAAKLVGVHKVTLYRRIRRGAVHAVRGMEDVRADGKEGRLNIWLIPAEHLDAIASRDE